MIEFFAGCALGGVIGTLLAGWLTNWRRNREAARIVVMRALLDEKREIVQDFELRQRAIYQREKEKRRRDAAEEAKIRSHR